MRAFRRSFCTIAIIGTLASVMLAPIVTPATEAAGPLDQINHLIVIYQEQYQIDGGKMDKYAAWSPNPGLVLGYYDSTFFPEGQLAQQFTMADNFFHAAFGASFLNHFWLICACTPTWSNAPASKLIQ